MSTIRTFMICNLSCKQKHNLHCGYRNRVGQKSILFGQFYFEGAQAIF